MSRYRESDVEGQQSPERAREATTLGVLFVHGIGTQRRGDTLLHAGGALHHWLRRWLTVNVELVDTDVTPADSDVPAHSRVLFRDRETVGTTSLLLAECHWAPTFHAPTYGELLRWAWLVVPRALLLHLVPRFRQAFDLWGALDAVVRQQWMPQKTLRLFERYVGRPPRLVDGLVDPWDLVRISMRAMASVAGSIAFALFLGAAAVAVLILLILLLLVSLLLPLRSVRQFALNVQLRLGATVGDSYLYLSRPLSASAVRTRLDRDLAWLAERCDRIVLVAHSQGAAVAYDTIARWLWTGRREPKLAHLITYGSGLGKLFDLRMAEQKSFLWTFLGVVAVGASIVMLVLALLLWKAAASLMTAFSLGGALGIAGLLLAGLAVFLLTGGLLGAASQATIARPKLLDGLEWEDVYASHDPVPNGPIAVEDSLPEILQEIWWAARPDAALAIGRFHARQRQVTNRRSVLADHTTYWNCDDDFVARVATRLLEQAGVSLSPLTSFWLELSARRRRWRIGLRSHFGAVTIFLAAAAVLMPEPAATGAATRTFFDGLTVSFFGLFTWSVPSVAGPEWLFRALALLGTVGATFCLGAWGFRTWERVDRNCFFGRIGYDEAPIARPLVGAGWLAVLASLPAAAALLGLGVADVRFNPSWPLLASALASAVILWSVGRPPGTPTDWALQLLQVGEERLREANVDCESLETARDALRLAERILTDGGHEGASRAAHGLAEAQKRLARGETAST